MIDLVVQSFGVHVLIPHAPGFCRLGQLRFGDDHAFGVRIEVFDVFVQFAYGVTFRINRHQQWHEVCLLLFRKRLPHPFQRCQGGGAEIRAVQEPEEHRHRLAFQVTQGQRLTVLACTHQGRGWALPVVGRAEERQRIGHAVIDQYTAQQGRHGE